MKKRKVTKIAIWTVSVFLVLTGILFVHIYLVTRNKDFGSNKNIQMSRIDFKQSVSTEEANKIQAFVKNMPGITGTLFNTDNGVLIYTYKNDQQNSLDVYTKLMKHGHYKAERFVVPASEASNGCPVMNDKDSFNGKLTAYIAHLFN